MYKKNKIIVLLLITILFSCKKKIEDEGIKQKQAIIRNDNHDFKRDCDKQIDTTKLKVFFKMLKETCIQGTTKISMILTENVDQHYYKNFCSLFTKALKEIEGTEEYGIIKDSENCKGFITINSINYYKDGEETHRNEYSTYFYMILTDENKIFIDEIGGAG